MTGLTIGFSSDKTNADETVRGSDGRLNVSTRADARSYYNSRDEKEAYSLVWDDASSEAGEYVLYWKNTDTNGRHLVIGSVGLNSEKAASFKLHVVTGTAAGGAAATPTNLNRAEPKVAAATARTADTTPVTTLTSTVEIDHASVEADGHEEFRLQDRLRIGQDGAIAIEYEQGDTGRTWGVVFGFYE